MHFGASILVRAMEIASTRRGLEDLLPFLLIPGFFMGPLFAAIVYSRYRNQRARHIHEQETQVTMHNLYVYDLFVETLKKHSRDRIPEENSARLEGKRTGQESASDVVVGMIRPDLR